MKYSIKIIPYIVVLAGLVISQSSCKKYLDINTDPTTATSVEPKLLFGYAITSWSAKRCDGDGNFPFAFAVQSISDGGNYGFTAGDVYDLSPTSLNNHWGTYYSVAGNNLQLAIKQAIANGDANTEAQCKVVMAALMYEATMTFGDIPYSESWNTAFPYPKFDAQKDVLDALIASLDEAHGKFDEASPLKIKDYDVYYGGDIARWKKLAKSLKLRILMTMVDKDPTKAAAIGALVSDPASLITDPATENWLFKYKTTTNNENPKFRFCKQYASYPSVPIEDPVSHVANLAFFYANPNVLDPMKLHNDPRIPRYFAKASTAATYNSVGINDDADDNTARISAYLLRNDAPDVLLSIHEIMFFRAEAYARGLGVTQNLATANTLYKAAAVEACKFYGVSGGDAATFAAGLPDLTIAADPVKEIHLQQWIDLMDRPAEAFTQWRRSGPDGSEVPLLTLPPLSPAGPLLRRFTYPADVELNANPNKPAVIPVYNDKTWFDL